jgi:GNAT superfamily N-acetyltransferase
MNTLILVDKVFNHYDNMCKLLEEHVQELAVYKDLMKLSPDLPTYQKLEEEDLMYGVFAYVEGKLVGYSINFVSNHIHYSELKKVNNDVIYVDKKYRGSGVGAKLINASEREAKKRGAAVFALHAKPNTPLSSLLYTSEDYQVQDIIFSKRL